MIRGAFSLHYWSLAIAPTPNATPRASLAPTTDGVNTAVDVPMNVLMRAMSAALIAVGVGAPVTNADVNV